MERIKALLTWAQLDGANRVQIYHHALGPARDEGGGGTRCTYVLFFWREEDKVTGRSKGRREFVATYPYEDGTLLFNELKQLSPETALEESSGPIRWQWMPHKDGLLMVVHVPGHNLMALPEFDIRAMRGTA